MPRAGASIRAIQGALATLALLVAAGGAVALIAPALGRSPMASAGQSGPIAAFLVLLTAASLVACGSIAWFGRPDRTLALIAFLAAAAWLAVELEGSASVVREARTLGMVITPLFVPLVVHLPIRAVAADRYDSSAGVLVGAFYAVTVIASAGHVLTYDPFFDVDCSPVCAMGDNVLAVAQDARLASSFQTLGLVAASVGALGLVVWAVARLVRARPLHRAEPMVLIVAAAVGGAITWWTAVLLRTGGAYPTKPPLLFPAMATAIATTALGAAVFALVSAEMRRAESVRRIADAISAGAGSPTLRATLSRTLADDRVRVAYPVEDGGMIDEAGMPLLAQLPGFGHAVTAIERGGRVIAVVEHQAELDPDLLTREIGAAARLAVDNERLEATIRSRLHDLQASRARIVDAGDTSRGRLERDLHDGAQQRLLAVSFELRLGAVAAAQASSSALLADLAHDIDEVDRALAELRDLAHGIHPVVLTEDGLSGALASLAEEAPIALEVVGQVERCPAPTELAAYLAVVDAVRRTADAGGDRVDVSVRIVNGALRLELGCSALGDGPWVRIEDRVGAAGGQIVISPEASGRASVAILLPCA